MRRVVLSLAIAAGLAIGSAVPSAAIGTTEVTLTCDDGTSTSLIVDADTLTGLTLAVQAMIDYPAGLTCTLVKLPGLATFGAVALASPGTSPFIVGGGRWLVPCEALGGGGGGGGGGGAPVQQPPETFWVNIAVNVHQADDGTFFGTLNETIPANQFCETFGPVGESHFTSKPVCLLIADSTAFVTSQVTQTSGQRSFPADQAGSVNVDNYVHFGFQDNGNPSQATDFLNGPPAVPTGDPSFACVLGDPPPAFDLRHGNISTHP